MSLDKRESQIRCWHEMQRHALSHWFYFGRSLVVKCRPTAGQGNPPSAALTGDPIWDDWSEPPRVPSIPVLHLDGFDGPMDLLLDLAERQRIDFGRMSILALADQFVAAVERLVGKVALERRADWHVLAARLVLLRSG